MYWLLGIISWIIISIVYFIYTMGHKYGYCPSFWIKLNLSKKLYEYIEYIICAPIFVVGPFIIWFINLDCVVFIINKIIKLMSKD